MYFYFSISSLLGGPLNWGYLHPQNDLEAGDTIALSLTTIRSMRLKGMVRNNALCIYYNPFPSMNFYFFTHIIAGQSTQQGYLRPHMEFAARDTNPLLPTIITSRR